MLVDPKLVDMTKLPNYEQWLGAIAAAGFTPEDFKPTRIASGVYEPGCAFNFHLDIARTGGSSDHFRRDSPDLPDGFNCYGVCDDYQQVLDQCPYLLTSDRKFVIAVSRVVRDPENKGRGGGWRWHKWGPYIGVHEPTTEYLDDEPLIEAVWCYHVYEVAEDCVDDR